MEESVGNYLDQIFKDRRYCPQCEAMTPILNHEVVLSGYPNSMCECCGTVYDSMFTGSYFRFGASQDAEISWIGTDLEIKLPE